MDRELSSLIKIADESLNFEELTTSITETEALSEGTASAERPRVAMSPAQVECLYRDSRFPIVTRLFNGERGNIYPDILEAVDSISPDLGLLLTFFSKFDRIPANFGDILTEPLDPLTFFCFMQEFFGSFATLQISMADERAVLSDIIHRAVTQTLKLSRLPNVRALNNEILVIARTVPSVNMALLKPILQECFTNAVYHQRMKPGMMEHLFDFLKTSEFAGKYNHWDNSVYFTTLMHFNASEMARSWIHPEKKMVEIAQPPLMLATEKVIEKVTGTIPDGSVLVSVFVEWEKRFQNSGKSFHRKFSQLLFPVQDTEQFCSPKLPIKEVYANRKGLEQLEVFDWAQKTFGSVFVPRTKWGYLMHSRRSWCEIYLCRKVPTLLVPGSATVTSSSCCSTPTTSNL
jgi:hypothetical protein